MKLYLYAEDWEHKREHRLNSEIQLGKSVSKQPKIEYSKWLLLRQGFRYKFFTSTYGDLH